MWHSLIMLRTYNFLCLLHRGINCSYTCSGAAVLRILCEGYGSLHSVFLHLLDGIFRQRLNVPEPNVELVRSWRDREAMGNGLIQASEKTHTQMLDLYIDQVIWKECTQEIKLWWRWGLAIWLITNILTRQCTVNMTVFTAIPKFSLRRTIKPLWFCCFCIKK